VLIARPITAGVAGYYFRGQKPGVWLGRGSQALDLDGDVSQAQLSAILQGRHPADGRSLVDGRPARRRAGWDLTFAAPKSVSLLSATLPLRADSIATAHRTAVADVVGHVERHHLAAARSTAPDGRLPVKGAVAVAFEHRTNSAAEPHVHSHVLLANLGQVAGGDWVPLSGSDWWPSRHALAALYQLSLRHHLTGAGWDLDWRMRPNGLADVADVPRAAVRATSTQSRAVVSLGRYEGRASAIPQPWQARAEAAGYGLDAAARSAGRTRTQEVGPGSGLDGSRLVAAVETRLAAERSVFRLADVLVALAACCPAGAPAREAQAWAERFCDRCVSVRSPSRGQRWTTDLAARADHRLLAVADGSGRTRLDPVATDRMPNRTSTGRPIEVLESQAGCSNLLAHAEVLDGWQAEWREAGLTVAIRTKTSEAAARWHALTAVEPRRAGERSDILIVDQADRWTTHELIALLTGARDAGTRTILVEGGTLPRLTQARSAGLVALGDALGRVDPGPVPDWSVEPRSPALQTSGRAAARRLLDSWARGRSSAKPPLLVGLGVDEVAGLNRAARTQLVGEGLLMGPAVTARGREFRAGDLVVVLRSLGSDLRRGTVGSVLEADPRRGAVTVAWRSRRKPQELDRTGLTRVGYGCAATPSLAATVDAPLLLLGDPVAVPYLRARVMEHAHAGPYPVRDDLARLRRPSLHLGL
jgi:conjugative relaxase-like TrwC/TraI family protein